jgi:hypothetical protein
MNPMNPNLYPESVFPQTQQNVASAQLNQTQRDIDRIIVHDVHGLPIKRDTGAIFKGDVENKVTHVDRADPHVPIGQEHLIGQTAMMGAPLTTNIPVTTTTTMPVTTTHPVTTGIVEGETYEEDTTATGQKKGFVGKMKDKYHNWKERRREKKAQKGEVGDESPGSSPSPSPERRTGTTTTTGTTETVVTGTNVTPPPTYITQGGQVPIRDTTKDYSRNIGVEVPTLSGQPVGYMGPGGYVERETAVDKGKDRMKTGSWDYPDQRIQRIEQHFPDQTTVPVFTQPVGIIHTTQIPTTTIQTTAIPTTFTSTQQTTGLATGMQRTEMSSVEIENMLRQTPLTTAAGLSTPTIANYEQTAINVKLPVATTYSSQPIVTETPTTLAQPLITETNTVVQPVQRIVEEQQFQQQQFGQQFAGQQLQQPMQQLASGLERATINAEQGNINLPYQSNFSSSPMRPDLQPGLAFQQTQAVQPGMMGDLTTGALRQQPLIGSSSQQPLQTNVRTVEKDFTTGQQILK